MTAGAQTPTGATYETEIPSVESQPTTGSSSGKAPTHHKPSNNAKAEGSAVEPAGGAEESGKGSGSSEGHKKEGSSSKEEEGHPATAAGGNGGSNGGANGGNGPEGSIAEGKDLGGTQSGAGASHSSGGSSPVVPILIAVVVLAAISIGVVLYRQRKSGQGGSDGRVSSSNAS